MEGYRAPPWLPGGNLQTIWPALCARRFDGGAPELQRQRWTTPDGDFIDV
ncbi:MAG TPA: alpha/beta hydrolase, partial [Albitalea sp.]|nr:alpha/beta hydrolase [Albitalea sp.]